MHLEGRGKVWKVGEEKESLSLSGKGRTERGADSAGTRTEQKQGRRARGCAFGKPVLSEL